MELAERIEISSPLCSESVRQMEREGVITGYRTRIDPMR